MLELFKSKPEEEIKKELAKYRDELIQRVARLTRLTHSKDTGWTDWVNLVNDYIDKCQKRKLAIRLDVADDKTIQELKYIDHEIMILTWAKFIPQQIADKLKELEAKDKEKQE